jgi:hypothetical protein
MAAMLEKSKAPSLAQVQGIEQLMAAQHAVMDQRSKDLGILSALQQE